MLSSWLLYLVFPENGSFFYLVVQASASVPSEFRANPGGGSESCKV